MYGSIVVVVVGSMVVVVEDAVVDGVLSVSTLRSGMRLLACCSSSSPESSLPKTRGVPLEGLKS